MNKKILILISVFICILFTSFSYGALTDSLQFYANGNNNANDSLNRNNGTMSGNANFTSSGVISNAFNFDGSGDKVDFTTASKMGFTSDNFTIQTWVKTGINSSSNFLLISRGDWKVDGWTISYIPNTHNFYLFSSQVGFRQMHGNVNCTNWALNTWEHIVWVRTGNVADTSIKMYKNGALCDVTDNGLGNMINPVNNSARPLTIGVQSPANAGGYIDFNGSIDEIGIWNRELSQSEIQSLYNNGIGFTYPFTNTSVNTLIYPLNQTTYNNFTGFINISTTNNIYCSINDTRFSLNSSLPNTSINFKNNTDISNLNLSIYINCSSGNNLSFWFIHDTQTPILYNLSILNNSNLNLGYYNLSFSVSDNFALWEIKTFINGSVLNETITNISLNYSISNYNYSKIINFLSLGNYFYNYTLSDAHTDYDITNELNKISEIPYITKDNNGLLTTLSNTDYLIIYPKNLTMESKKEIDRVSYIFTNLDNNKSVYYTIESTYPIQYLKNSKYKCHFIINNLWKDCEGLKNVYVEKETDYKYKINFELDKNVQVTEKSTGILNTISYTGGYNVVAVSNTTNTNISININNSVYINISVNITNTNYNYNNVSVNITNTNTNTNYNNVSINNTLNVNNSVSVNNTLNVNNSLNFTNTNNINLTTNYTININITNPSSSLSTDTTISNIYMTFIFLFLIYVLLFIISANLNTKVGLMLTFVCGVLLGGYFYNSISGVYSVVGIIFIMVNCYFFIFTAISEK